MPKLIFKRDTRTQRRLSDAINQRWPGRYIDWREYVAELIRRGDSYAEVCESIATFGISLTKGGLHYWLKSDMEKGVPMR